MHAKPCPPARRGTWLFFVLALGAVVLPRANAAASALSRGELLASAQAAGLASEREWRLLLHLMPGLTGRERTQIDDVRFFLATDGRTDPEAELRATIEGFLRAEPTGDEHAICRFPARFSWLTRRLGIDASRFPQPACSAYAQFRATVAPRSVVLVFPVGFSNSPATMFGHTLLRLDAGGESDLLSSSVSYAAEADEGFGPRYAIKGLVGLYDGYYYVMPYWDKINQYTYMESRDIWEYRLALHPAELDRLADHLWELNGVASRYYFFDENCASNLLILLEIARPELELTDRYALWVVPVDTLRAVLDAGIVSDVRYRPSRITRLQALAGPLDGPARDLAIGIARGITAPQAVGGGALDPAGQARVLDTAAELHQLYLGSAPEQREEYSRRLIEILGVRSALPAVDVAVRQPARPEEGHGSMLAAAGVASADGELEATLRIRPVYHGLLDRGRGYQEGAAIAFGDTELRWRDGAADPVLERFALIDITSLAPVDRFQKPNSWQVGLGIEREMVDADEDRTVFFFDWRAGRTLRATRSALIYLLPGVDFRAGGALENFAAAGVGATAGALLTSPDRWQGQLAGTWASYFVGERRDRWSVELGQGLPLAKDVALQLTLTISGTDGSVNRDAVLWLNWYF